MKCVKCGGDCHNDSARFISAACQRLFTLKVRDVFTEAGAFDSPYYDKQCEPFTDEEECQQCDSFGVFKPLRTAEASVPLESVSFRKV